MSTIQCCCDWCQILVEPLDRYGVPIVGATVNIYWNAATVGAYLDPLLNDTVVGPFTTTSSGVEVHVDSTNGVYMVEVIASGYATTHTFSYGCSACHFPHTGNTSTTKITTGGQDVTLGSLEGTGPGELQWGCGEPEIHDLFTNTFSGPFHAQVPFPASPCYSWPGPSFCSAPPTVSGTTGLNIFAGCHRPDVLGPPPHDTVFRAYYYYEFMYFNPYQGYYAVPPGLLCGYGIVMRAKSTITYIQTTPFRVEGTWDGYDHYCLGSGYEADLGPTDTITIIDVNGVHVITPMPTPLTGDFVIQ